MLDVGAVVAGLYFIRLQLAAVDIILCCCHIRTYRIIGMGGMGIILFGNNKINNKYIIEGLENKLIRRKKTSSASRDKHRRRNGGKKYPSMPYV